MSEQLNLNDIKQILPHREPMLLIEEGCIDEQGVAHAKYKIKEDEFFTRGHFPGNPIVPGVIQCEIMAQGCALLVKDAIPGKITLYAGMDKVKFKNVVRPGDVCEVEAKLTNIREIGSSIMFFCDAKITVDGKLCSRGELTFALVPKE